MEATLMPIFSIDQSLNNFFGRNRLLHLAISLDGYSYLAFSHIIPLTLRMQRQTKTITLPLQTSDVCVWASSPSIFFFPFPLFFQYLVQFLYAMAIPVTSIVLSKRLNVLWCPSQCYKFFSSAPLMPWS